ncbi:MAG: Lrp/AsnC family transcriptional regulator [Acinetobacter sp.]|uniref:Lrp/AsnC family transcriptional regulator n=1 Tax=Acinetobacter faecalis TaxID=2665161 RepID=UPI001B474760|nr:Lrp/AsnC family transcriptional regulator [Acinetobacter faecalis]MBP8063634.1 Lrp/AsnC family transcriptional regulator [Acinetobacter sp.]MDY6455893.1 Lrp/AsnC family transcriptional regulator [Acinetobacter faecalis]
MSESNQLDGIDIACINALISNPRGSWRELSLVSEIPEKKLSRRINKLFDDQVIRTSVELNPLVVNKGYTVHVWISVKFGKEKEIAQFFSKRPEVRIVFLTTGLADIFLEIGLEKPSDLSIWMHDFVTQIPDIKTVETQAVLKPFTWASKPKTDHEIHFFEKRILSDIELNLIHYLSEDGRASIKSLSEKVNLSEHKTQKLLNDLLDEGIFNIRIDLEPQLLGFESEAIILIKASPLYANKIAKSLSEISNTRCLFGISGDSQFFWHVLTNDLSDLWKLITEELSNLDGILSCNTNMITLALKRAGFMRKLTTTSLLSTNDKNLI